MYDLGDTVPLGVDVLDADGAATVPGTIALTVELPDGTTVSLTPTTSATGRYTYDYIPTQAGRHEARWTSTTPATAYVDVFDVRPAAPRYLISVAQAKAALKIPAATLTHDERLRGLIEAATEAIEAYLGETVVRRTEVELVDVGARSTSLVLSRYPVVSVSQVVSLDGLTTWAVGDLDVDGTIGQVRVVDGACLSGTVVVTYVAGRSVVPAHYARAAELVVADLFQADRRPGAGPVPGPLAESDQLADSAGVFITPRVRQLLGGGPAPLVA